MLKILSRTSPFRLGLLCALLVGLGVGGSLSFFAPLGIKAAAPSEQQLREQIAYFQPRLEVLGVQRSAVVQALVDQLTKAGTLLAAGNLDGAQQTLNDFLEAFYRALDGGQIDRTDFMIADVQASIAQARQALPVGRRWQVGKSGDFTTIGAAIRAASPGDTILIEPGHYEENLMIDKAGLTLEGQAAFASDVRPQAWLKGSLQITQNAVTLRRLAVSNAAQDAVTIADASYLTLDKTLLTANTRNGLSAQGSYHDLLIEESQVTENGMDGVHLEGSQGAHVVILRSEVSNNGRENIRGVGVRTGGIPDVIIDKSTLQNNPFAAVHPEDPLPPITIHLCQFAVQHPGENFEIIQIRGSQLILVKNHPCGAPTVTIENLGPATIIVSTYIDARTVGYPLATLKPGQTLQIKCPDDGHLYISVEKAVGVATVILRLP